MTPVCHVCGALLTELWAEATDVEYGTTDEQFGYWRCPDCDALSITPLPADRLTEIYPSTYYSFATGDAVLDADRNLVTRMKARLDRRALQKVLENVPTDAPRILDVGGGTGDIAAGFVAATDGRATATVVDFDPATIDVARQRGLHGFVGRFEDFETDERFDLILMLNLIEHVADPGALLRKARELLAPGGVVWLQTPNYRALDARLFRRRNWTGLHCPRHWVVFSDEGLRTAMERSGLEVRSLECTQGGSFWATSMIGLVAPRRPQADGTLPTPLIAMKAFMPLAALGAAFDLLTRRLRRTSQVVAIAGASD